jgi:hypothetical protein
MILPVSSSVSWIERYETLRRQVIEGKEREKNGSGVNLRLPPELSGAAQSVALY